VIEVLTIIALIAGIAGVLLDITILVRQREDALADERHWQNQEKLDRILLSMEKRELADLEDRPVDPIYNAAGDIEIDGWTVR
jgi:hypothetical protein